MRFPLVRTPRFSTLLAIGAVSIAMLATAAPANAKALVGMSAPADLWAQRLKEVGPGIKARRIFYQSFTDSLNLASTACNAGMTPIISFKTGKYSWAQVGSGAADTDLKNLAARLKALPCASYVVVHHEPNGDGTAADYNKMQIRALPILTGTVADTKVKAGVIVNGFWFGTVGTSWGAKTDAQLDEWVGPNLRKVSEFIAADTYQLSTGEENIAPKIKNMGSWARRVNAKTPLTPVKALGLGEFNSQTAQGITDGMAALKADSLFAWGCLWNVNLNTVTVLSGARLTAFRTALQSW